MQIHCMGSNKTVGKVRLFIRDKTGVEICVIDVAVFVSLNGIEEYEYKSAWKYNSSAIRIQTVFALHI